MTTKEKLLSLFEEHKGIYFSGEELAHELEVSRTAVWKAVKALKNEGYNIDAVNNRGYSLSEDTDILSVQGVKKYLNDKNADIEVLSSVDSTNNYIKKKAASGAEDGFTVIAARQSAGRGRYGRTFFSPDDSGLYMSVLLRPRDWKPQQAVRITTMAAVAVCETINSVSDDRAQIKWVNDIFMRGKKVCGILTEASFDLESGMLDYAVLGAGINVYPPEGGFPEEIKDIAGSVFPSHGEDLKNRLAADFINRFMYYYHSENPSEYTEKYRNLSLCMGKEVNVISSSGSERAKVTGIDDECRLQVKFRDGTEKTLSYGEISIKL